MHTFKKQSIIRSYPAYDIVRREKDRNGFINVTAGETMTDSSMLGGWYFGSVVSYALEYNKCPLDAVEQAKSKGHDLYWLNAHSAGVSSNPTKLDPRILIEDGDIIRFEGKLFTVAQAPNNNKQLIPYKVSKSNGADIPEGTIPQ